MEYKMIRRRTFVLLYVVLVFPTIDGTSNTHFLRRSSNEPERLVIHGHTEGIGDDQSQSINTQRQFKQPDSHEQPKINQGLYYQSFGATSRPKSDKKSKEYKHRTDRHDNILYGWDEDELFTTKNTKNTKKDRKAIPPHKSSATTQQRVRNTFSKHTTIPLERKAPGYEPIPTPTLSTSYHDANRDDSLFRSIEDPKSSNQDDKQGKLESPIRHPTNFLSRPCLDQQFETVLSQEPPTFAPVRLPTRQQNYDSPPTRTGLSIVNGDLFDGNDDWRTDDDDQDENDNEQDIPISSENEENDDKDGVPIVSDDKENEVVIDQETKEDEGIIEDPAPIDYNEGNDGLSSFESEEDASKQTWKYVLIGLGSSCLLFVALAMFLRRRSPKFNEYIFAGDKDGDANLETIDNTTVLDQTGVYSGYSRMNSTKSFPDFEDTKSDTPEPSLDYAFEPHDPHTKSSSNQSLGSKSMYEFEEEVQMGNIDNYADDYADDDDDDIDDDDDGIDEDIFDDDEDDDIYLYNYDYEIDDSNKEGDDDPYIEDDPNTEEVDATSMEESTISWEEEGYLSTIDEESNKLGDW
jgi:hypothetical protein